MIFVICIEYSVLIKETPNQLMERCSTSIMCFFNSPHLTIGQRGARYVDHQPVEEEIVDVHKEDRV